MIHNKKLYNGFLKKILFNIFFNLPFFLIYFFQNKKIFCKEFEFNFNYFYKKIMYIKYWNFQYKKYSIFLLYY